MRFLKYIPVLLIMGTYPIWTPTSVPSSAIVEIPEGYNVSQIGNDLEAIGVVTSSLGFKIMAKVMGLDSSLKAGRYVFTEPTPVWQVVARIHAGDYGTRQIKITIPEGYTNPEIGDLLGFNMSTDGQGYLFPDTYYFDEFAIEAEVRATMRDNFNHKVATITKEELIVASILEKEVRDREDMKIVAGILYKRLAIDMPLQVDAVPSTYETMGLPEFPICNPGLRAIEAAKSPTKSLYLYYLSGTGGVTHYAKTFDEHRLNKSRYLR